MAKEFGMTKDIPAVMSDIAWSHIENGEEKMAIDVFNSIVAEYKDNPYTVEALYKLATYFYGDARYNEAIQRFNQIISGYPQSELASNSLYWIAWGYFYLEQKDKSLDYFENYLTKYPKGYFASDANYYIADTYYLLNNMSKAKFYYQKLITDYPASMQADKAQIKLAEIKLKEEAKGNEEAYLLQLIEQAKSAQGKAMAQLHLAQYYIRLQQVAKALPLLNEVKNKTTGEEAAQASFELGEIYRNQGKYSEALDYYGSIFYVYKFQALYEQSLYWFAYCSYQMNNAKEAVPILNLLIQKYPSSEWATKGKELLKLIGG